MFNEFHPLPWRVDYQKMFEDWHEKSLPRIVDAAGATVIELPQNVGHPGLYDAKADETAQAIVAAMGEAAAALSSVLHQLSTDSDLETIAGAAKYAALEKIVRRALAKIDPRDGQLRYEDGCDE